MASNVTGGPLSGMSSHWILRNCGSGFIDFDPAGRGANRPTSFGTSIDSGRVEVFVTYGEKATDRWYELLR